MEQGSLILSSSDILSSLKQGGLSEKELDAFFQLCKDENNLEVATRVAEYKLDNFFDDYPSELNDFHLAAQNGDLFLLQSYVRAGINVNLAFEFEDDDCFTTTGTALTLALVNNNKDCIRCLLEQPNIKIDIVGLTAIERTHQLASLVDDKYVVPFLEIRNSEFDSFLKVIDFDVDVRWGDYNEHSCFIDAFERADLDTLKFALDHGANPNQYVDEQYKEEMLWPMAVDQYISSKDRISIAKVKLLLEYGADLRATNYDNQSVLELAWQSKDETLISLFGLELIADEFAEVSYKLAELENKERILNSVSHLNDPLFPICTDILSDIRASRTIPIGHWIKRLIIKQISPEQFSICIEQIGLPSSIELPICESLANDLPRNSVIKLSNFLVYESDSWWMALEEWICCPMKISLFSEDAFFDYQKEYDCYPHSH